MMPTVRFQRGLRLHAQRVVEPALGQVDLDFSVRQLQAVAFALGRLDHARQDRAALVMLRINPRAGAELVVKTEGGGLIGVEESLAVKCACQSEAAGRKSQFTADDAAGLGIASPVG